MKRFVLVCFASVTLVGSVRGSTPILPNINTNNVFNVTNAPYNATADGNVTNTTAIQNAINDAAAATTTSPWAAAAVLQSPRMWSSPIAPLVPDTEFPSAAIPRLGCRI